MDFSKLGFSYIRTNTIISSEYRDGRWSPLKSCSEDTYPMAAYSPSLHYGVSCFEGLKAFNCADGRIRLFRPQENARRIRRSAAFLGIPAPDEELFISACLRAVDENREFIPPYGLGASLYIRPILVCTIPDLGLMPPQDGILFMVIVTPIGSYSGSILSSIKTVIARDHDRAAPNGSGQYKVSGNYAGAMLASLQAKKDGYKDVLYLNPGGYENIDEFSSANFFAIKGNSYLTPLSNSVLPSITNKSLQQIAADMGMNVEKRIIPVEELAQFDEVGQCGTAVVITPVEQVDDKPFLLSREFNSRYTYDCPDGCGDVSRRLYKALTGIQSAELPDTHGWCLEL